MAGEHILKLMDKTNIRVVCESRRMYYDSGTFTIFKCARETTILCTTEDEALACRILKGE